MTAKYDNFISELKQLCIKHQVCIECGYDGWTVHDMLNTDELLNMRNQAFWQDIGPADATEEE